MNKKHSNNVKQKKRGVVMNFYKDQKNEKREAKKHLKSGVKMGISATEDFAPVFFRESVGISVFCDLF